MKKTLYINLLLLIFFSFSLCLYSQTGQDALDQTKLMKQQIGTWKAEIGEDTTFHWEIIPCGKGYESKVTWKAKGEPYATAKGIIGFTWENQYVNQFTLWQNGMLSRDLGKFVSEKKLVMERFNYDHTITLAKWELKFETPDKITSKMKWKGVEDNWDNAEVSEWTFIRVNN